MSKIFKNLLSSFLGQAIAIALGLIIPRLILTSFGSEINGLTNSTSQLFAYVALLEAGVGTATLQALYAPLAQGNKDEINGVLSATHCYYKRTGLVYLLCVLFLAIGYPLVVDTTIDTTTIILVVLLQGLTGVLNYFFQGKYRILLQAEGKNYILTNLATMSQVLMGFGKVVVIYLGFDVVAVQAVALLANVIQIVVILSYIKTKYKWVQLSVAPNFAAINQKYDVLVAQIATLIFNNTDVLLLTLFCDLKVVSVYSLYLMLCNMINSIVDSISSSLTFKFGELYHRDFDLFKKVQRIFEKYYIAIICMLYSVACVCLLPFIRLYTDGVTDADYLNKFLPFSFVVMQVLSYVKRPYNQVVTLAQHFRQAKWRALIEAGINLTVSLVGVYYLGIFGVLLGSIVALLYRIFDLVLYSNRRIMKEKSTYSFLIIGVNLLIAIGIVVLFYNYAQSQTYIELFLKAVAISVTAFMSFIFINALFNIRETRYILSAIKKYIGKLREKYHSKKQEKVKENTDE